MVSTSWLRANARLRVLPVVAVLSIVAASCASTPITSQDETTTSNAVPVSQITTTTSTGASSTSTDAGSVDSTTTTTLDGEPYVGSGPQEGEVVAVIGVAYDDVLNVRSGPGTGHGVVGTLEPVMDGIGVTGNARLLTSSIWYEITVGEETGWVNASYIGLLGGTEDATAEVEALLGTPLGDDDLLSLAATIAYAFAGEESGGRMAVVETPTAADPFSVTIDVVGLDDDSIIGYRLVIGTAQERDDGPFELVRVDRTSICWRGVTTDGLCV